MLQLVNSSWLWALAALSIPLMIHLWNIRQGKVLKVGSIALIAAASKKSSRSFRFTDLLLLVLRCALLILIALLLSWPVWQKKAPLALTKGWVLIPKESMAEVYSKFKSQLDSLHKAGYELHQFDPGFAAVDSLQLKQLLQTQNQSNANNADDYWMLLKRLNSQVSAGTPVYLYTANTQKHFNDIKSAVGLNLHWQTYTPADSVSTWIAQAWLTPNNSIRVTQGNSHPAGTSFSYYTIKSSPGQNSPLEVNTAGGKLMVSIRNNQASQVPVDTAALRFAIYTDANGTDAGYVKAALQTLIQFSQRKAIVRQYSAAASIPPHQDWVFWLSGQPVPARLQQSGHVFYYTPGTAATVNSWFNTMPQSHLADDGATIGLYKTVSLKADHGQPIWTDGFGHTVLSRVQKGQAELYRFGSRFNPAWSDLVWNERFPQILFQLVFPPAKSSTDHDRRVLSYAQLMPLKGTSAYQAKPGIIHSTDLRFTLWLIAALLFVTERLLAHRTATQTHHG